MAIKVSSSKLIDSLIADLTSGRAAAREAAVVRLTLVGPRAVERLMALAASADATAASRGTALRTLEAIGDPRALRPVLAILSDRASDPVIAIAAAAVARVFLTGRQGAAAVDRLTSTALDRTRPEAVRVAALKALRDLKPSTIAPLLASLASDASAAIQAEAAPRKKGRRSAVDPLALLTAAAADGFDDGRDAAAVSAALADAGDAVPLPDLHRVLERIRDRESAEPVAERHDWTAARAAAHLALARRGSRLALYDLRESLQAATPLPVEFITALSMVGDASCLEAIAVAHTRTKQAAWRNELAGAFAAIVTRGKLTKRHPAVKKIAQRSARTLEQLWPNRSGASRGSGGLVR